MLVPQQVAQFAHMVNCEWQVVDPLLLTIVQVDELCHLLWS